MQQITFSDLQQQSDQDANSFRLRAHRNWHPELSDRVQSLAIAPEKIDKSPPTQPAVLKCQSLAVDSATKGPASVLL